MKRFKIIACKVLSRELDHYASLSDNTFDIQFLEQGLHNTPDILRTELQKAIDAVEGDYDAILIGYGLCCNGVQGIVARKIPLVVVKGHDCITHLLGSKERYREYFDKHPGTYWYSPGWIDTGTQPGKDRNDKLLKEYIEKFGEDNAKFLMETEETWMKEYTNAAYVDLGFGDNEHFKKYTQDCAKLLGWKYDELKGDPGLVKRLVDGEWGSEAFLIVRPGQKIVASNDKGIIRAE